MSSFSSDPGPANRTALYWVVCACIALAATYTVAIAVRGGAPMEDAAMLMRYAGHLAGGHGMVWNVGEAPVDGATDFLFTVLIAGVMRLGVTVETATRSLIVGANLVLAGSLLLWRREPARAAAPFLLVAAAVAYVLLGPANRFAQTGFGAPVFALAGSMLYFALSAQESRRFTVAGALLVASAALLLGLLRPEGNLLAGLLLLAFAATSDSIAFRRTILIGTACYAIAGAAFLAWRTWYFGQLMPNPFYRKGGFQLYPESFWVSLHNGYTLLLPFLPCLAALLLLAWRYGTRLRALREIGPVLGFLVIWILLVDDNNHWGRFQYAVVPIGLLAALRWSGLLRQALADRREASRALAWIAGFTVLAAPAYALVNYRPDPWPPDGRYAVAERLRPLANDGMTMAVTEAGLLPLYSEWRAVDVFGLNDQWIARHGAVTAEYLDRYHPDLLMMHENTWPQRDRGWQAMVDTMKAYAGTRDYVLAAKYARGYSVHYYFVRRASAHASELIEACRPQPYIWWLDGRPITNQATTD